MLRQINSLAFTATVIAACATPQQQCIANATQDLRVVQSLIVETERNLSRGYAVETETRDVPRVGLCTGGPHLGSCVSTVTVERERPVAIDLAAERRKLGELRNKERELRSRAQAEAEICKTRYPAGT